MCVCSVGQEITGLIFISISSQLSILWTDCSLTTDGGPWSALQPQHRCMQLSTSCRCRVEIQSQRGKILSRKQRQYKRGTSLLGLKSEASAQVP